MISSRMGWAGCPQLVEELDFVECCFCVMVVGFDDFEGNMSVDSARDYKIRQSRGEEDEQESLRVVPCEPNSTEMAPPELPDDRISAIVKVISDSDWMIPSRTVIL